MPTAVLALTAGAIGIGTTEFIIMGPLLQVAVDMQVSIATAGLLISGYALGVCVELRVIEKVGAAGQTLASSLNIAAFNLGNALGAWAGAVTIEQGPGLPGLPFVAAVITATGLAVTLLSLRIERRAPAVTACPEGV